MKEFAASRNMFKTCIRTCIMTAMCIISIFLMTGCGTGIGMPYNAAGKVKGEYDYELTGGDGLHLVMTVEENVNGMTEKIGVVDDHGKWIQEPSASHPFLKNGLLPKPESVAVSVVTTGGQSLKAASMIMENARVAAAKEKLVYLGEGICGFRYHAGMHEYLFYDLRSGASFDAGSCTRFTEFHDGYLVCAGDNHVTSPVKIISHGGRIVYPDLKTGSENLGCYSEGKFFNGASFYDLDGNKVIDLEQYTIVNSPAFSKGKCRLEIENNIGSRYRVDIDDTGAFLSDPVKLP